MSHQAIHYCLRPSEIFHWHVLQVIEAQMIVTKSYGWNEMISKNMKISL